MLPPTLSMPIQSRFRTVRRCSSVSANPSKYAASSALNRRKFKADEAAYLDGFALTEEQRRTVLKRDWIGMLKVGGNIYYTIKIAFCDGLTFQDVASMMSGVSKEEYAKMMLAGGRSAEGNRYKADAGSDHSRG